MNEQQEIKFPSPEKNKSVAAAWFEYVEMFVFAAIFVILLMTFALRLCVVSGPSMNNTLQDGERLVVSDFFYSPKQGDIIVFHQTSEVDDRFNEPIVKRVIAVGGQYVKIDYQANKVYVSDDETFAENEVLDESDYAYFANPTGAWKETLYVSDSYSAVYQVPEGYLFVLGDNRNVSADSRDYRVGFVDERRVLGKVLFRLTPFSAFGKVD
ncbi:MAG: signal peptidase I [Clostridia bacterium]|nr:signal peptidase I [Clostridia bacterium]